MYNLEDRPNNYLVHSILATLFCCWPLGVVAIIQASKVNTLYAEGDFEGAQKASKSAKTWTIWSAAIAVIFITLFLSFFGLPLLLMDMFN